MGYKRPDPDPTLQDKLKRLSTVIAHLEGNLSTKDPVHDFTDKQYIVDYAHELNAKQLDAVTTIDGKTLVIAGAGSGKTRILTYRTSFLLETGVRADNILLLTFTRKAATEITTRVNALLAGQPSHQITSGTFHSFCYVLLRRYATKLGINPKFTIIDQEDSRDAIHYLRRKFVKTKQETPFPKSAVIQAILSAARNRRLSIEQIIEQNHHNCYDHLPAIMQIAKDYAQHKQETHTFDYDDLIDEMIRHLRTNPEFQQAIQKRYPYIMVDEYQDTNLPQKELIDLCAQNDTTSLLVVGDDNQSIYAFRGANYENILAFGESYPEAKLIKLEQNYRSTPRILNFINSISDQITLGYRKALFSPESESGSLPVFLHGADQMHEAEMIVDKVIEAKERLDYKDMAVLCRSSFHSNDLQAECLSRNVPFIVVGGLKFVERRHIKDILAYLKLLANPVDRLSWHRVLLLLDGIGRVTADKIADAIIEAGGRLSPLQEARFQKYDQLATLYAALNKAVGAGSLAEIFAIIKDYYLPVLKGLEEDWQRRGEDFHVVERLCAKYGEIDELLSHLALDPPNDSRATYTEAEPDSDAITISTIHSAKGLEWPLVFVMTLIDGAVPSYRAFGDYEQLEEECRLFYVACSRARQSLYMTAPLYFTSYGAYFDDVSRFLDAVDGGLYETDNCGLGVRLRV